MGREERDIDEAGRPGVTYILFFSLLPAFLAFFFQVSYSTFNNSLVFIWPGEIAERRTWRKALLHAVHF
jgi:hypothetical protein